MSNLLKIDNIEKYYGSRSGLTKAINNISFEVSKGEFVAIMGSSGSGKTTLLNCISTIDRVTSGHIYMEERDITKLKGNDLNRFRREELGFIFQDFNLLDTLTIEENISLSLIINNENTNKVDEKVKNIADKLGISDILKKFPYEVSGGQKQRCACARALINKPKLILADEPTGNLDSKSSDEIVELLKKSNREYKQTNIMTTHKIEIAKIADRIIEIEDGKIVGR